MKGVYKAVGRRAVDALAVTAGSLIYAAGFVYFIEPNRISPGGATGLSSIIHELTGFPVGVGILIINIPLFAFAARRFGLRFLARSAFAMALSSAAIDLPLFLPAYVEDRLLAALFGSILCGLGLALIYARGAVTGGSDLLSRLIRERLHHISMGRLLLMVDGVIVLTATVVFGNLTTALYSVISIYVTSQMIDKVLAGLDVARVVYIVSERYEDIGRDIVSRMGRGVTLLKAEGGYSGRERTLIMCAVRRQELFQLKKLVLRHDNNAFFIVTEAAEVLGEGFKTYDVKH